MGLGNRVGELAGHGQRHGERGTRFRESGLQDQRATEVDDGIVETPLHGKRVAEVVVRFHVVGIQRERLLVVNDGFVEFAAVGQGVGEIVVCLRIVGTELQSALPLGDGFTVAATLGQGNTEIQVGDGVIRLHTDGMAPLGDSGIKFPLLLEVGSDVGGAIEVRHGGIDLHHAVRRDVDEFGDVYGAVGGGGVVDQDGRAVGTVVVDVGEEHLGVRRATLGGEHHPPAIGREAVPGVHAAAYCTRISARPCRPAAGTM